ncbi:hypothetical protein Nmel_017441 [Mimus melanotis]
MGTAPSNPENFRDLLHLLCPDNLHQPYSFNIPCSVQNPQVFHPGRGVDIILSLLPSSFLGTDWGFLNRSVKSLGNSLEIIYLVIVTVMVSFTEMISSGIYSGLFRVVSSSATL